MPPKTQVYRIQYLHTESDGVWQLFGSKSTISRFGERFCDGQYSLVSFLFAGSSTHGAPRAHPYGTVIYGTCVHHICTYLTNVCHICSHICQSHVHICKKSCIYVSIYDACRPMYTKRLYMTYISTYMSDVCMYIWARFHTWLHIW